MLNMGNATKAVIRAGFGAGRDPVWLDEVKCLGESGSRQSVSQSFISCTVKLVIFSLQ